MTGGEGGGCVRRAKEEKINRWNSLVVRYLGDDGDGDDDGDDDDDDDSGDLEDDSDKEPQSQNAFVWKKKV